MPTPQISTTGTGVSISFSPEYTERAVNNLKRFWDIGKRYVKRKVQKIFTPDVKLTSKVGGPGTDIVDLSKNVVRVSPGSKQKTVLFNEFVETKNPSIHKASEIKNRQVATIGDNNIPVQNFMLWSGIEGRKYKVGNINQFNDTTTVIPVRNIKKGTPPIKKIYINPNRQPKVFGISINNDTIPFSAYGTQILDTKKMILGNDKGNSLFIGDFTKMSPAQFDYINRHLLINPSYPIRTDLGSFELYKINNPTYFDYMNQFLDVWGEYNPNTIYVVGTD